MKYPVTREGLQKMEGELKELRSTKLRGAIELLQDARERGDLLENSEYHTAREIYEDCQNRIQKLENLISQALIIEQGAVGSQTVQILTLVSVKNQKTGTIQKFEIVPENEIDTKLGKISYKSPVGSGLIGKSRGQKATIQTPTGSIELEILDISPLI